MPKGPPCKKNGQQCQRRWACPLGKISCRELCKEYADYTARHEAAKAKERAETIATSEAIERRRIVEKINRKYHGKGRK